MTRREGVQLVALLASFVVAGYAGVRLLTGSVIGTGTWFVGSAVVHDLVLFPLYAGIDAALVVLPRRHPGLVSEGTYHAASGLSAQPFLARWIAVTAVLFAISAATLVARAVTVRAAPRVRP